MVEWCLKICHHMNKPTFPLWDQFVENKSEWIGGLLTDHDSMMGDSSTIIEDISIEQIGSDWAFCIGGKDFDCDFNVKFGGIAPRGDKKIELSEKIKPSLKFWSYGGVSFTIEKP